MFDEIELSQHQVLATRNDKVVGYVDLESNWGRKNEVIDHVLVVLIHGLKKSGKQPIAFYFTKGTFTTVNLRLLIKGINIALKEIGLKNLATFCDQWVINSAAIRKLSTDPTIEKPRENFYANKHKFFIIFVPQYLLKFTCFNQNISFSKSKYARSEYVKMWFVIYKRHSRVYLKSERYT